MSLKTRFSLVLFVSFLIQPLLCYAQWGMTIGRGAGESSPTIRATSDGGCVVVSQGKAAGRTDSDIWILKLNALGEIIWQKEYDSGGQEIALDVRQTEDSGYIVAGAILIQGSDNADILILKLTSNGDIAWQKRLSSMVPEGAFSVLQTKDGGYIVSGEIFPNNDQLNIDIILVKLTAQGNISWQKTYGGDKWEWWCEGHNPLIETADGYVVAANIKSFGTGGYDFWVLKLNAMGEILWQKAYGSSTSEQAESIWQTSDGGYIVAGEIHLNTGTKAWLLKLTADGWLIWQKAYNGSDPFCEYLGTSVWESSGGELILGGGQPHCRSGDEIDDSDGWLIKLDMAGNPIWMKSYGGSRSGESDAQFQPIPDGGFLMVRETDYPNLSATGVMILRLDERGEIPGSRCSLIHNDQAVSVNTSAVVVNTPVVPQNSNLVSSDANLVARDVLYEPTKLCVPLPRPKAMPWLPLLMDD